MTKETKHYMKHLLPEEELKEGHYMSALQMQIAFAKSKITSPTLEEFPNVRFITLTLRPEASRRCTKTQRLLITSEMKVILHRSKIMRYSYTMEFTKKGTLHVHMWLVISGLPQLVSFIDSVKCSKLFGIYFVTDNKEPDVKSYQDQITDMIAYMKKDLRCTIEICKTCDITGCSDEDLYVFHAMEEANESEFSKSIQAIDESEINYEW